MKIKVDKKGLGFSEITFLAIYHPLFFAVLNWMISHKLGKVGLQAVRLFI